MRGTRSTRCPITNGTGIIPAYAGNTSRPTGHHPPPRDHPRVCGEHSHTVMHNGFSVGSSPRMRGTLIGCRSFLGWSGIIPAYAGNTTVIFSSPREYWDHPRVCGEHSAVPSQQSRTRGSSPRMRGTRFVRWFPFRSLGIIPAYAGNTGDD